MMNECKEKVKENTEEIDYTKTQSFLCCAITDVSGHIKFLDTKVSIVMAALGVIMSGTINCRKIVYETYRIVQTECLLHIIFCVVAALFFINIVLVYIWGLLTIKTHVCNIDFKSLWFIKDKKEKYPFEAYMLEVKKMTTKDIIDNISAELYKLNDIYRQKVSTTRKTIVVFAIALIMLFIGILMCIYLNI